MLETKNELFFLASQLEHVYLGTKEEQAERGEREGRIQSSGARSAGGGNGDLAYCSVSGAGRGRGEMLGCRTPCRRRHASC